MSELIALTQNDIQDKLRNNLKHGGFPGTPTMFDCLNQHYTHKAGGVTDWTGSPASGKTYFVLELLMGLSEKYEQRHGLWLPDLGSEVDILQKLVKMHTGKDFNDKYQNKITDSDLVKALPWIFHHFVIFKKKDFKEGITPINFWDKIITYKDTAGELHTGTADSWKNFKHLYAGREDSYLDEVLSIRNEMAEDTGKHFHTIAHAVKTELAEGLTKGSGKRRVPTAYDIKGGGSWYANGKNIITVDRPNKQTTFVDIYVQKTKPEDVGSEGNIIGKIKLDPRKGRYYETIQMQNYFAYQYQDIKVEPELDFGVDPSAEVVDPPF